MKKKISVILSLMMAFNLVMPVNQVFAASPTSGSAQTTPVEFESGETEWTWEVPAAQTFTDQSLEKTSSVKIKPLNDGEVIVLDYGTNINVTLNSANGFALKKTDASEIPYQVKKDSAVLNQNDTVLTYTAGVSANTGVEQELSFETTLDNIKYAKLSGMHSDNITFTLNAGVVYTVTDNTADDAHGTINVTKSVREGDDLTIEVQPEADYTFKSLKIVHNGNTDTLTSLTDNQYVLTNVQSDVKLTAEFKKIEYNVTKNVIGNGDITVVPTTATKGNDLEITATPDVHNELVSLEITHNGTTKDVFDSMIDNKYVLNNVQSTVEITATFEEIQWIITTNTDGHGTITEGTKVTDGSNFEIIVTPDLGYQISTFIVDGADKKDELINNQYVIKNVKKDTTVAVTFIVDTSLCEYTPAGWAEVNSDEQYQFINDGTGKWISNNHYQDDTSAISTWTLNTTETTTASIQWSVSSESGCDKLIIMLNETTVLSEESGENNGTLNLDLQKGGNTLTVTYSKDSSSYNGNDEAWVILGCDEMHVCEFHNEQHVPNYQLISSTEASCTQTGSKHYECFCGLAKDEIIPKAKHNYVDGICSNCGTEKPIDAVFTKRIANPGCHTYTYDHSTECWEDCNDVLSWEELQDSENGEKYGYDASKITDTELRDGAFEYHQGLTSLRIPVSLKSIGDYALTNESLKNIYYNASRSQWDNINLGYASLTGDLIIHCTDICFKYEDGSEVLYGDGVVSKEATCEEDGIKSYECICGATRTRSISALGHDYQLNENGSTTCTRCGRIIPTIPEGGTYYVGVTSNKTGDYTGYTAKYEADDLFPENVNDRDIYVYGDYEYRYNGNGWDAKVLDTTKESYDEVLHEINGKLITKMDRTYAYCTSLIVSPSIPDTVESVQYTFENCTSLTTAPALPDNIKYFYYTFSNCSALKTYTGSTDADGDFSNYIIPDSVLNMNEVFSGCANLIKAPVIPGSVTGMRSTFRDCTRLTESPVIPDSVTDMSGAFANCTTLTTAPVIPESVTNMQGTFLGCTALTTAPILPTGLKYIGTDSEGVDRGPNTAGIFYGCSNLKTYVNSTDPDGDFSNYTIPDGITKACAIFYNCKQLTKAPVIPDGVTDLSKAFYGCTNLEEAPLIPNNVTNMTYTFGSCINLKEAPVIPNSVTNMSNTFNSCVSLTTAPVIPDSVTIMFGTFKYCTNLTTAPVIPDSVISMRETFSCCTSLKGEIEINANPTEYRDCFYNCAKNEALAITLKGTSTKLNELKETDSINFGRYITVNQ